jgi:hypothetical protein
VRAWFATEAAARKEAERRNQEMRSSPGIPEKITDDELLEISKRPFMEIIKEVKHLRLENRKMRKQLKLLSELSDRDDRDEFERDETFWR